jgi:hypothetical protein
LVFVIVIIASLSLGRSVRSPADFKLGARWWTMLDHVTPKMARLGLMRIFMALEILEPIKRGRH